MAAASMEVAQAKVEAGDYDGALRLCTEALERVSDAGARARCHLQRSHCWQQLGDLKRAVRDAEACLGLQVSGGVEEGALLALAPARTPRAKRKALKEHLGDGGGDASKESENRK